MYTSITVKQILDRKGSTVFSLSPDVSVFSALRFMAEKNIGAVMVMLEGKLVGVFSERDYARKVALEARNERRTPIEEVMTTQVVGIRQDRGLDECLALMTNKFIRHLPVIDEQDRVVGVISIGDVVKELIEEQGFVIDQLVHYITGEYTVPAIPDKGETRLP
jgi:CBS domain-containing protein